MRYRPFCLSALCLAFGAIALSMPAPAVGTPLREGLVLWLDAADAETVTSSPAGTVSRWADKSGRGNHAEQTQPSWQPERVPESLGGKPALRFGGDAFLNLGQPESLAFGPGDPFTIAAVFRVSTKRSGTFLAKGGGGAQERAYQLYVAPGRHGAITHGVMRECPRTAETNLAVAVCAGSGAEVYVDGRSSLSLAGGKGNSTVDVLVGGRRQNADNTGAFYLLNGDLAEILVYNRALSPAERTRLETHLKEKYSLDAVDPTLDDNPAALVALLATPEASARLDQLATRLALKPAESAEAMQSLLQSHPQAAPIVAESLVRIAQNNRLAEPFAALAGNLLEHDDPFVGGLAEWAIAMKVGGENNGQQAAWPSPDPPEWYRAWQVLSPYFRVEADWVRQAVSLAIHRGPEKLADSVARMCERAARMAADFQHQGDCEATASKIIRESENLESIRAQMNSLAASSANALAEARRLWLEARRSMRAVAMANPAVGFDRVVFVTQFTPHTVRNITRSYAWKHKPGGDLSILSGVRGMGRQTPAGEDKDAVGKVERILRGRLGPGYVWGIDLWWEGDRVVFGYAKQPHWPPKVDTSDARIEGTHVFDLRTRHEPLHLYEVNVDGSRLVQRTDHPYWSDFEPTYCADGQVVFASDRCGRAAECGNDTYDHTNPNLYLVSPDGAVRQLTDSKDIDRYPHSLSDGRIAYTHWEYQERHFMEVHALWTLRPDGTMSDALFKHHMQAPCGLRDTRAIPGSTKLVSIATGHHTFAYGPVVVVDPTFGMNSEAGLRIVTPGVHPQEGPMAGTPVDAGGVPDRGGLYHTPFALSENCFLASYAYDRPHCTAPAGVDSNGFGLYLIDVYGNRELLHRDPILSCTFPIPLRPRPRPPVLPDVRAESGPLATCYVSDVYDGMPEVSRGTIKYLRISQHVGWPFDPTRGQMDYIPGTAGAKQVGFQSWSPVRVIGTVPVAADGSASFLVPADTAVYFQALDERRMEVRRMRSMVSFSPGEVRGCTGCHESQARTPAKRGPAPLALAFPPQVPDPPPWGSQRLIGYEWLVQPVLDRHCVRCHGRDTPDGNLDFSGVRAADGLFQSYRTMFGLPPGGQKPSDRLVACSDRFSNAEVTAPRQFGSYRSRLVRVLVDDPLHREKVRLGASDWESLVTWVDANAPYHDAFIDKRPTEGGSPSRNVFPELRPLTASNRPEAALVETGR